MIVDLKCLAFTSELLAKNPTRDPSVELKHAYPKCGCSNNITESMLLWCPECGERHIDEGEFATRSHHTHACQHCGHVWRPAIFPTLWSAISTGVQKWLILGLGEIMARSDYDKPRIKKPEQHPETGTNRQRPPEAGPGCPVKLDDGTPCGEPLLVPGTCYDHAKMGADGEPQPPCPNHPTVEPECNCMCGCCTSGTRSVYGVERHDMCRFQCGLSGQRPTKRL